MLQGSAGKVLEGKKKQTCTFPESFWELTGALITQEIRLIYTDLL